MTGFSLKHTCGTVIKIQIYLNSPTITSRYSCRGKTVTETDFIFCSQRSRVNQTQKGGRLVFLKSRQEPFKNVSKLLGTIHCKTSARKELAGFSRLFKHSIDHDSEKHITSNPTLLQTSCALETVSHAQPSPQGAGIRVGSQRPMHPIHRRQPQTERPPHTPSLGESPQEARPGERTSFKWETAAEDIDSGLSQK